MSRLKKFLSNFRNNYNDFNQDSVRNSNFKLKYKWANSLNSLKHEQTQNSYIKRTFLSPLGILVPLQDDTNLLIKLSEEIA